MQNQIDLSKFIDLSVFVDDEVTHLLNNGECNILKLSIALDADKVRQAREISHNFGRFDRIKQTMEFGFYPRNPAKDVDFSRIVGPTGKKWHTIAPEYVDPENGEVYAMDGKKENLADNHWYRVEPYEWKVKNMDKLGVNSMGDGSDKFIVLSADYNRWNEDDSLDGSLRNLKKEALYFRTDLLRQSGVKNVEELAKFVAQLKQNEKNNGPEMGL